MQLNKLYTGIALASALVLTGCGDNDDSVISTEDGSGPIVNNELNYVQFHPFSEVIDGEYQAGWGKLALKLNNNGFLQTISTVLGSSPKAYQDSKNDYPRSEYYAGKNLFVSVPEEFDNRYYKINFVDSDTFKLKFQSEGSTINSTYDIITLDLTGVGRLPNNAKTGIDTDLSYLPHSIDATFPSGSQCYIILETPDQDYYSFHESDKSFGSVTIDDWIANEKEYNVVSDLVDNDLVGKNNELQAARYTNEEGYINAAVKYDGSVYYAEYHQRGVQEKEDINPKIAVTYCDQYNSVAAKFLETQIKTIGSK